MLVPLDESIYRLTWPAHEQKYPAGSPAFDPSPEFVVFGVATEYCVRLAVDGLLRRGRRVCIVTDAVRSLNHRKGQQILESLESCGARLITSEEALKLVGVSPTGRKKLSVD